MKTSSLRALFFGERYSKDTLAQRRLAFTLIELLVTMAVGLLLIAFLFQLFNSTTIAWRNGENQNDTYREARAAMQLMERDISQITAPLPINAYSPSPSPSPTATPSPNGIAPVLVLDRYSPTSDPPMQNGDEINEELYCLTNIPNSGTSNLCAVGYFCMWMPDLVPVSDPQYAQKVASAPHAYALVRQFLGSGGYASPAPTSPAPTPPPGLFECFEAIPSGQVGIKFTDIFSRARPPTTPDPALQPPQAVGTQLASYIWDLQFRTPDRLQAVSPTPAPKYYAVPPAAPPYYYQSVLPAYVEIRFKALSAGAARQLEGNTAVQRTDWNDSIGTPSAIYQRLILPGARQFVVRVPLASGSSISTP